MEIKIYYKDTDCGGVVYYGKYLEFFEVARTEWMADRGIDIKYLKDNGIQFIVKTADISYHSPAKYGETINVETLVNEISGASLNFKYEVTEKITKRLIATGFTKMVCINDSLKPRRLPVTIKDKLTL